MQFELQKVIVPIPLAEYAAAYKEAGDPHLHVWVNVPRARLVERDQLDQEYFRLMGETDILRADFHGKLESLKKQETEEERKATAVAKERKRLVAEYEQKQDELQARVEDYTARNYAWFVDLWSQGPEGTRWSVDEIKELAESDHMLLGWLVDRTRQLLSTRRVDQKNA